MPHATVTAEGVDRFSLPNDIPDDVGVKPTSSRCGFATPAAPRMREGGSVAPSRSAGRGWIPASLDIGLPNDPVRRRTRQDQEDFAAGLAPSSSSSRMRGFSDVGARGADTLWAPACAGVTKEGAGVTKEGAGVTKEGAG